MGEGSAAGTELTRRLYQSMWAALGGPGDAPEVAFTGGEVLAGPFAVSHVGAASFAAVGAAVADLVSTAGGVPPAVRVDRTLASAWLAHWSAPVGWTRGTPWHGVSTDYAASDGRWVRLQANYEHLRRAAAKALGATEDREAFARAIAAMTADEAEHAIVSGGGAAAATRTLDEWAAHPQGQAAAAEPLIDTVFGGTVFGGTVPGGPLAGWAPTPERPLAGIRVLDITRVLAGPVGTRTLAGYGAEVLRIDPPGFLEPEGTAGGGDLTLGKRCVYLDLGAPAGRDTFLTLLSQADVLVHGLRPGALDGLGLGADARRAAAPGVIEVTLNAYGWTGPWRDRRGFDTLVQTSSGMSTELMRRGGLPGPKLLPSQVLDFATGYLIAAAAVRGLAERARTGRWSSWRLALARTGALLRGAGEAPAEPALGAPADDWYEDRVYNFPKGPVRRLAWPATVERAPLFWERAGDPYGTATPIWATAPNAARTVLPAPAHDDGSGRGRGPGARHNVIQTSVSRSGSRGQGTVGLQILALPSGVVPQAHQAAITYQRGWGKYQRLPMIMFAIVGGEHPIMVDTGTPEAAFVREYIGYGTFERPDDEDPLTVLGKAGIDPADVRQVVLTHLHWDHCSNLELFPNATFTVQDRELRYAVKPIALHNRAYQHLPGTRPPWLPVLDRVTPVLGTAPVAPGVSVVHLPGHTPGSQGVLVETDAGRYLIAGDNLDSYDNWAGDASTPHIPSGAFSNLIEYTETFAKIEALECEPIPSHDQRVLDTRVFG